jgi:DNA-binding NtrC family response regulator
MERAVILSTEDFLTVRDFQFHEQYWKAQDGALREDISQSAAVPATPEKRGIMDIGSASGQELNLEQIEYRAIMEALKKNHFVISRAAKDLGLTRAALYRRMVKYGI